MDNNTAPNNFLAIDDADRANRTTQRVMEQLDDKGNTEFTVNADTSHGWNWQHSFTTLGEAKAWARYS